MKQPLVSVIIPTYNRKDSLLRTLDSLSRQTYLAERFEVIVVDDGGSDGTEAIAQRAFPSALLYLRQENQGEVVARNHAVEHSAGEILVFLDDDIEVNQEYLAALVAAHGAHPRAVVMGRLIDIPVRSEVADDTPTMKSEHPVIGQRNSALQEATFLDCMSGIVSISRDGYLEVGAMQPLRAGEGRNIWGGIDFGYRAHQQGFAFWRAQSTVAFHHDEASASLRARCRRGYQVSKAAHDLFAKYPALQRQIPMFREKHPIDWRHDSLTLILNKLSRQALWSRPGMWTMEHAVRALARYAPGSKLLPLLHRWVISGYIFRGYRDGLQESQGRRTV